MNKVVLLDIDGVLIPRNQYFSERFAEDYGIELSDITPFFTGPYRKCVTGEADLKVELKPYLKKWHWEGNVDDFLDYWFSSEAEVDEDMMKLVDKLKEFGVDCLLASDNECYRAEYLLEEVRMADYFDESFFSCDLGVTKDKKEFFVKVAEILNVKPSEIIYFDDDEKNVEAALTVGFDAHVFKDADTFKIKITPLISN